MRLRGYQLGELIGIVFLLASTAMQLFYLEPLKREIEWRLVAFNTQQSAQIQLRTSFDNQIALLKLMNAPAEQVTATEAKRDATLGVYKNSDADISDFMIAKASKTIWRSSSSCCSRSARCSPASAGRWRCKRRGTRRGE